jgi:hypothetical protein
MGLSSIWAAALLVSFLWLANFTRKLVVYRRLVRKFPGPNGHSMIWGHAKILGEVSSEADTG